MRKNQDNQAKIYPFTAIVGQEAMKKALILNVINPLLGGVLIRGEKGTAKSTAVRALAEVIPPREEHKNCFFSCDPLAEHHWCESCKEHANKRLSLTKQEGKMRVVNLPISATEDRVIGTLDIEHAIKVGEKKFERGILAQANRNILYVDEVNLLEDHIVDILLDAAAMGVNIIEREGISYAHPAKFVLVGTMNPEEGDLRPQLIDRFGLVVDVVGESEPHLRIDVIENRLAFENNPEEFLEKYRDTQTRLGDQIAKAKEILPLVGYKQSIISLVAKIAIEMGVDGHRADITLIKTAMTHAAYRGSKEVNKEDLLTAARLVLPHRMRKKPFEEKILDFDRVAEMIEGEVF